MAVHDRIPLIDLLRKNPANAGFFYGASSWILGTLDKSGSGGPISMESAGTDAREHPGSAPH
jgi:hypothetical protein